MLLWMLINYGPNKDLADKQDRQRTPRYTVLFVARCVSAAIGAAVLMRCADFSLLECSAAAVGVALAAAVVPLVRNTMTGSQRLSRFLAEWELLANVTFLVAAGILTASWSATITGPALRFPVSDGKLATIILGCASLVFVTRGGTHIVRGVLDKAGTLPVLSARQVSAPAVSGLGPRPLDTFRYHRGRVIGYVERILLLYVVAVGSYEALGFLVAAKGLIRAREFEDRDFAEYFIVGSLVSVLVALVVGAALRVWVSTFWEAG